MADKGFDERLYRGVRKPAKAGAFSIQLTPEQQEQLAELIGKTGESIARLEVELVEGNIAPAAVLVGVAG